MLVELFHKYNLLQAVERANIHMSLLLTCNTEELTLHKKFNVIYEKFREIFPELSVERVGFGQITQICIVIDVSFLMFGTNKLFILGNRNTIKG